MSSPGPALAVTDVGSGPATVLLHPLGADRRFWSAHLDALPGRLIAVDLPGHGESADPGTSTIASFTAEMMATLDDLRVDTFAVVGVSIGGLIAQYAATHWPERVRGVALVDTVGRYPDAWGEAWRTRAEVARSSGLAALVGPTLELWFTEELLTRGGDPVAYVDEVLPRGSDEGYARACEALAKEVGPPAVPAVPPPSLVVVGADDLPLFVEGAAELARTWRAGAVVSIPGRHGAALESSRDLCAALAGFLAGLP